MLTFSAHGRKVSQLDSAAFTSKMDEQTKHLLKLWEDQLAWKQKAHTHTSRWATLKTSWVDYPTAALSALAGTSVVASFIQQEASNPLRIAAIILSLFAAALSAINTQKPALASCNWLNSTKLLRPTTEI
jgi:hypothetical protein